MKALFISGSNQYGVVTQFLTGMKQDLEMLDVSIDQMYLGDEEGKAQAVEVLDKLSEYDFIVSFNTLGLDIPQVVQYGNSGQLFVFLVDHPVHLLKRFIGLKVKVMCVDEEHVAFCRMCNIEALFFPHAVGTNEVNSAELIQFEQKSDEILFPVSYFDLEKSREKLTPVWHEIESILANSSNITRFWQNLGVLPLGNRPATVQLNENVLRISILVDFYLRASSRQHFLEKYANAGISLTVTGNNSAKYQELFPQHRYEEALNFTDLKQRIANTRYLAHNSPGFERGYHERVITPLSLGTLVLSEVPFLHQAFPGGVIQYQDISTVDALTYDEMAKHSFDKVQQRHTWKAQWQPILESF